MVTNTNSSKYLSDFSTQPTDPGKSPLALLARACETIGLHDISSRKCSASERKEDKRLEHNIKPKSPRSTESSRETTLPLPVFHNPSFRVGPPPLSVPILNPLTQYHVPFPRFSIGSAAYLRCGDNSESPTTRSGPSINQLSPEMISQIASHQFFSMYANMLPSTSNVPELFQDCLLHAPSFSHSSKETIILRDSRKECPSQVTKAKSPFMCNWIDSDKVCGKTFKEEFDISEHLKKEHNCSPAPSTASEPNSELCSVSGKVDYQSNTTSKRFNPYGRGSNTTRQPLIVPAVSMAPVMFPILFPTAYANRNVLPIPND